MSIASNALIGAGVGLAVFAFTSWYSKPAPVFHIARPAPDKMEHPWPDWPRATSQAEVLIAPHPTEYSYDERTVTAPYNPGPQITYYPIPKNVRDHRNLHLPDPVCLAGCESTTQRKPQDD